VAIREERNEQSIEESILPDDMTMKLAFDVLEDLGCRCVHG
jgi:hypothetical protein